MTNPVSGSMQQTLFTINGQNFVSGVTITLQDLTTNGRPYQNLKPVLFSTTQLALQFTFGCTASTWSVAVVNPGMPPSKAVQFSVVAAGPTLVVTPPSIQVPATAGTTTFSVTNTGCGTLKYSPTPNATWLSIGSGQSGSNSETIGVNYSANTGAQRSGTIQVNATDSTTGKAVTGSPAFTVVQLASGLAGKGEWIVNIAAALKATGSSTAQALVSYEKNNGINYLIVKAGEGNHFYGDKNIFINLVGAAQNLGLKIFGFHYVYGGALDTGTKTKTPPNCENTDPTAEDGVAIEILNTGVDGLVIDAELEYFNNDPSRILCNGKVPPMKAAAAAQQYITTIRNNPTYATAFLAHSPFPIPTSPAGEPEGGPLYDTPFPFMTFGAGTQAVLPQAYYRFWDKTQTPQEIVQAMNTAWNTVQKSWANQNRGNYSPPAAV